MQEQRTAWYDGQPGFPLAINSNGGKPSGKDFKNGSILQPLIPNVVKENERLVLKSRTGESIVGDIMQAPNAALGASCDALPACR
jgi:hypothetical protein